MVNLLSMRNLSLQARSGAWSYYSPGAGPCTLFTEFQEVPSLPIFPTCQAVEVRYAQMISELVFLKKGKILLKLESRLMHSEQNDGFKIPLGLNKDIFVSQTLNQLPTDLHIIRITSSDTHFKALVRSCHPIFYFRL